MPTANAGDGSVPRVARSVDTRLPRASLLGPRQHRRSQRPRSSSRFPLVGPAPAIGDRAITAFVAEVPGLAGLGKSALRFIGRWKVCLAGPRLAPRATLLIRGKELKSDKGSRSILVVDDDTDIREGLSALLESEGFAVSEARNGQEGLELIKELSPALILLDLMMPVMNGWEFGRQLRSRPEWADIPVIVLSAAGNVRGKASEFGALAYLPKPFDVEELLRLIRRALSLANSPVCSTPGRSNLG